MGPEPQARSSADQLWISGRCINLLGTQCPYQQNDPIEAKSPRRPFQAPVSPELESHFSLELFSVHQSHFRKTRWERQFARRFLKSCGMALRESLTDGLVQPAHLEGGETQVTFLPDFLQQIFALDLLFSFFTLFPALFSWPLSMEALQIQLEVPGK